MYLTRQQKHIALGGAISASLALVVGLLARRCDHPPAPPPPEYAVAIGCEPHRLHAIRREPKRFRRDTHLPGMGESSVSGQIDPANFDAKRDLVWLDDKRVWWESDNDSGDTEDDHSMHHVMELPLRRLIELMWQHGATLKVQDVYRDAGVHSAKSLHKEGRAIDMTSDDISLEQLAKLCWAAGFDWVLHEASAKGGAHVHCSVKH